MNQPNPSWIFAIGFIGALAPEVVRLYKLRYDQNAHSWSWFYIVISALFGGLGGTIALILPATTYFSAFYAGVSTPILVSTILRNAGAGKMAPADIEATRREIKRREQMTPSQRRSEKMDDLNEAAGSSLWGFLARKRQLHVHDYLNSL